MIIKRNIIIAPEKRMSKGVLVTDNVPIRIRVIYKGDRVDLNSGLRINLSKWDEKKQRVKNGHFNKLNQSSTEINSTLSDFESKIQDFFKVKETEDKVPTSEELKSFYNTEIRKSTRSKTGHDLFSVFDIFTNRIGIQNNWTDSTYAKHTTIKNHLIAFNKKLKLESFDENTFYDFIVHLQIKADLKNSTIMKHISFVKAFLRWANKNNYYENDLGFIFKPKLKTVQKKVIFLTIEEQKALKNLEIPDSKEYLNKVRDVFLFLCYTGLRYSDAKALKKADVKSKLIEVTTKKTSDILQIELNKESKRILEKYSTLVSKTNKALPVISNQKMNDYLEELFKLAEFNEEIRITYYKGNVRHDDFIPKYELLRSHAGRRTFICTALSLGIPVQVVMKWTGHSDYKSMKPYIDVADNIKAVSMDKFNTL